VRVLGGYCGNRVESSNEDLGGCIRDLQVFLHCAALDGIAKAESWKEICQLTEKIIPWPVELE
jgi:hypothetical protein